MPHNASYINWKKKILKNSYMTLEDTIVNKRKKTNQRQKNIDKFKGFYGSFNDEIASLT